MNKISARHNLPEEQRGVRRRGDRESEKKHEINSTRNVDGKKLLL